MVSWPFRISARKTSPMLSKNPSMLFFIFVRHTGKWRETNIGSRKWNKICSLSGALRPNWVSRRKRAKICAMFVLPLRATIGGAARKSQSCPGIKQQPPARAEAPATSSEQEANPDADTTTATQAATSTQSVSAPANDNSETRISICREHQLTPTRSRTPSGGMASSMAANTTRTAITSRMSTNLMAKQVGLLVQVSQ